MCNDNQIYTIEEQPYGGGILRRCNKRSIEKAIIPGDIEVIAERCFENCRQLTSVVFPSSLKRIEAKAFSSCRNLEHLIIPDSVEEIGENAFSDTKISELDIPVSVKRIVGCLTDFYFAGPGMHKLSVALDNPVYDSRDNCNAIIETATGKLIQGGYLTEIPEGIKIIGKSAFAFCEKTELVIPDGVEIIEEYAFCSGNFTTVTIPDSVIAVGSCAFSNCENIRHIHIPQGVTCIKSHTFERCISLKVAELPKGIEIEDNAFLHATDLVFY